VTNACEDRCVPTGRERQAEIFLGGAVGHRARVPFDFDALEQRARSSMTSEAFAYVAGAAGAEETMRANRRAFERIAIVPRVLRDVSSRDTSVELFGRRLRAPVLLAPIGVLELAHRDADLAAARAAASVGLPAIFSSQASRPMEEVAAAMDDATRWFQLYWSTNDDLVGSFVERAERCGCEAIVITLDTTLLGWRTRDLELAYLPFLRGLGIAQYTSDPVFGEIVRQRGRARPTQRPTLAGLRTLRQLHRNVRELDPRASVQTFTEIYSRPSLRWDDLLRIRDLTSLPVLLKGILHPDDARRAVDVGFDGIIVSNHGGRQLDGAVATLDALPPIIEVVGKRIPVLLDSGIRTGSDVLKALALGATAVLLGRPYVYGLAIDGEAGVREVLLNLLADFDLALGLSGATALSDLEETTLTVRAEQPTRPSRA
jgi:isopentenyl diphosphate isomerase/L-lactate dehydrogenase-like FMN-dependent dehydrogenase